MPYLYDYNYNIVDYEKVFSIIRNHALRLCCDSIRSITLRNHKGHKWQCGKDRYIVEQRQAFYHRLFCNMVQAMQP